MHDLPPPVLLARALSFAREEERIFGPLDFAAHPGEALVVEGDNGAGKTTLMRILAGLLAPTSGELELFGVPIAKIEPEPGRVAVLGHQLGLKVDLTPRENLRFRLGLGGARTGISVPTALKSVGLEGYEDAPVRTLSAGQRKRVALAALLLGTAALWLLDEPYANLDREGRVLVDRMLEAHCAKGGAVVLTSHGLLQPTLTRCRTVMLGVAPERARP